MSRDILIGEIRPNPRQPRQTFEGIEELAESLKAKGQVIPVMVRPVEGGYELVHGERRWRAAQLAGLPTLRAEVRELSDTEAFHLALIENLQRDDLTPIEEAEAYQSLQAEGMIQADIGKLVGKGQSYVAQKLRLLALPDDVREGVGNGRIAEGHARQLLRLKDSGAQSDTCRKVIGQEWTVAQTRLEVDVVLLSRPRSFLSITARLPEPMRSAMLPMALEIMRLAPGVEFTETGIPTPTNPIELAFEDGLSVRNLVVQMDLWLIRHPEHDPR